MAKISVIIPCYNAEKYMAQCLDSVTSQSLQDIEIICVDDGSTDKTPEILQSCAGSDSRVQVLYQQNRFAGVARNSAMAVATGEYLAFLDADDYYEPDALEAAYRIAKENALDMLKLPCRTLDEATGEINTPDNYALKKISKRNEVLRYSDAPELLNCIDVAWNGLYRRQFLTDNHIAFNELRCSNDRSFFIKCLLYAQRIMVSDVFLTVYRRNVTGSLVSIRHQHFDCQIVTYNMVKKIVNSAPIDDKSRKRVLRQELNQVFHWYHKALDSGVNPFHAEEIIADFVKSFLENDVGKNHLSKFQYANDFRRFQKRTEIQWQAGSVEPKISVIIPVYNGICYLSECIESVLEQSFRDFEMICVDDGSEDSTMELLQCFAAADSRIRILTQDHGGAGVARNLAMASARGKYLLFVDADDAICQDYLQDLYDAAEENSAEVVITLRIPWYDKNVTAPQKNALQKQLLKNPVFSRKDFPDDILNITDGAPGGKLFSREFVQRNEIRFLTIRRSEDFYFIKTAFAIAGRICFVDKPGYLYRKNNPSSLENTKDETPLIFWEANLLLKENLRRLGCLDEIKRSYLNDAAQRFEFNLRAMKSYDGFCAVFQCLKQVAGTELELEAHEPEYFSYCNLPWLLDALHTDTPGDFLYRIYRDLWGRVKKEKDRADAIQNSRSNRLGRALTLIPRKLKKALQN